MVVAIALGLPSSILGLSFVFYQLVQKEILTQGVALGIFVVILANSLYLMVRYAISKKD